MVSGEEKADPSTSLGMTMWSREDNVERRGAGSNARVVPGG